MREKLGRTLVRRVKPDCGRAWRVKPRLAVASPGVTPWPRPLSLTRAEAQAGQGKLRPALPFLAGYSLSTGKYVKKIKANSRSVIPQSAATGRIAVQCRREELVPKEKHHCGNP